MERGPFGFPPELRTPPLASDARQGGDRPSSTGPETTHPASAGLQSASPLATCDLVSQRDTVHPVSGVPAGVRKIIYTTNSIESLNYQLRKIIKNRGHFPNDDAVVKLLWLAIRDIEDKRARERAKEAGRPKYLRKAPPKLVEGATRAGLERRLRRAQPGLPRPARGDPVTAGRPRTAGFLHPGQSRRRAAAVNPPTTPNVATRLDRGEHRHTMHGGGTPPPDRRNDYCVLMIERLNPRGGELTPHHPSKINNPVTQQT